MYKAMFAALVAASLIAAPLPQLAPSAAAQTAAPAKTDAKTDAKPAKAPSAGVAAMRERQKKCGAEWKEAKAAGKIEKGMKWPQYWSACNKRLKSAS
jgi:Ni/Co efflux regulator RcnB